MPTSTYLGLDYVTPFDPAFTDLWGTEVNDFLIGVDLDAGVKQINQDFNDKVLSKATLKDIGETTKDLGTTLNGAVVVDYEDGNYQYGTLNGNISGLTINNPPASGIVGFITLELNQDATGSRTMDLTGGTYLQVGGGSFALTTTASAKDKVRLETRDGGSTWFVSMNANIGAIT